MNSGFSGELILPKFDRKKFLKKKIIDVTRLGIKQ